MNRTLDPVASHARLVGVPAEVVGGVPALTVGGVVRAPFAAQRFGDRRLTPGELTLSGWHCALAPAAGSWQFECPECGSELRMRGSDAEDKVVRTFFHYPALQDRSLPKSGRGDA